MSTQEKPATDLNLVIQVDNFVARSSSESLFESTRSPLNLTGVGLLGLGNGPVNLSSLLKVIPTPLQAARCLESYEKTCAYVHRVFHRPTFWAQVERRIIRRVEPIEKMILRDEDGYKGLHWLACFFATCGLGLYSDTMSETESRENYLPVGEAAQHRLARVWLQCATSALTLGRELLI